MADHGRVPGDLDVAVYCGETANLIFEEDEDGEHVSTEVERIQSLIRSIYESGRPFYTKKAMQTVSAQIKSSSEEILITAIDGQVMPFRRRTAQILDKANDPEYDWVVGEPFMAFLSVQELLECVGQYLPPLSLCSMQIHHTLLKRRRETGALCSLLPSQSRDKVVQWFRDIQKDWEASDPCKQLRVLLAENLKVQITKVIAFACGRMAFSDRIPWAARCAYQHALILTIRDVCAQRSPGCIPVCYAQDPIYCDLDREVLLLYDIRTLDSPDGFLEIDDSTVVLSFSPDIPIRQIVADMASPAIMIWDQNQSWTEDIDDFGSADPDAPRLTKMLQNYYKEYEFPGDLAAFQTSAIFVKTGVEDHGGGPGQSADRLP